MVVHPGAGNYKNTLANALAFKYKKKHIKEYWQKRKSNFKEIKPNDFQIERALLFNKFFIFKIYTA